MSTFTQRSKGMDMFKLETRKQETKFFFESAEKCQEICLNDFSAAEMTKEEKACANNCFEKQKVIMNSVSQQLYQKQ